MGTISDFDGRDYPAAHSMDVTWVAVDKCGHMAVLKSGQEGPVPNKVQDAFDVLDLSVWGSLDVKALLKNGYGKHIRRPCGQHWRYEFGDLYVLRGGSAGKSFLLGKMFTKMGEKVVRTGKVDDYLWIQGSLSEEEHEELHRERFCVMCLSGPPTLMERLESMGIFFYEGSVENVAEPQYLRSFAPVEPIVLNEYVERGRSFGWNVREEGVVKYDSFCFKDKPVFQPMNYTDKVPATTYAQKVAARKRPLTKDSAG